MAQLAALRASSPKPPMVTALDLQANGVKATDMETPKNCLGEEELCCLENCQRKYIRMKSKITDLNQQIEILTAALCEVTRRYRALKRWSIRKASKAVSDIAPPLLPNPQQFSLHQSSDHPEPKSVLHLPDRVTALSEHNGNPDPMVMKQKNMDGEIFRIKNCLVNMAEDNLNLPTVPHTSEGFVMLKPLNQLKLSTSQRRYVQVSTIKRSQARKNLVSKPHTLAGQVRAKKTRLKIERALKLRRALSIK